MGRKVRVKLSDMSDMRDTTGAEALTMPPERRSVWRDVRRALRVLLGGTVFWG